MNVVHHYSCSGGIHSFVEECEYSDYEKYLIKVIFPKAEIGAFVDSAIAPHNYVLFNWDWEEKSKQNNLLHKT